MVDYYDIFKIKGAMGEEEIKKYKMFEGHIMQMIEEQKALDAMEKLDELLKVCTDHHGLYYLKGMIYYKSSDYKRAIQYFKQAAYYDMENNEYAWILGDTYYRMGEFEEADKILEKALKTSPEKLSILITAGSVQLALNNMEKAVNLAENACKLDPHSYEALKLLSKCYIKSGESLDTVIKTLEKVRAYKYDIETEYEFAKALYISERYDESLKLCQRLIIKDPNSEYTDKIRSLASKIKSISKRQSEIERHLEKRSETEGKANTENLRGAIEKLNSLIGMDTVKGEIDRIVKLIEYEQKRRKLLAIKENADLCYHFVFTGNPGTGKTTVARLIGEILFHLGLLKKGHLVEVDRSKIVGQFIGQTAILTQQAVEKAIDGVLFVDEAYSLARPEAGNDFGKEAVETLLKAMEDQRGKITVILAGYPKEMRELMKLNPGLKSRINMEISFPDYTDGELISIANQIAVRNYYNLGEGAQEAFLEKIDRERVDENFANARTVRNIMEQAIREKAFRMGGKNASKEELCLLEPIDFGIKAIKSRKETMEKSLMELEGLTGLEGVKSTVRQIVDYVQFELKKKEMGLKTSPLVLHMQFVGNPGTGKTTVARILSRIFRAIGVLKRGHLVEVSRADLVGRHVGETAPKTLDKIKEAYGGVLFIDEAYSLCGNGGSDFGEEAITTLIKEMEDSKDKLVVIMAGYPDEMERLIEINPGMRDRLRFRIEFSDYGPDQMIEIFKSICIKNDYLCSEGAIAKLYSKFSTMYENRDRNFGNGRLVEKCFEAVKINHARRVVRCNLSNKDMITIMDEDISFD